ncbi:MAG: FAD-binding protein [Solirubrobacteraceae bacterium]
MRPAETAPGAVPVAGRRAPARDVGVQPILTTLSGWGGGAGVSARVLRPRDEAAIRAAVSDCSPAGPAGPAGPRAATGAITRGAGGAIARGMGRSYGDAAQLAGGLVLDVTALKGFELDEGTGTILAGAGTTIGELLHALVPAGWMVPVVPGTQHVSVGGAIASDIHGKSHASAGTFGCHVHALGLLTAAGEVLELERGRDDELLAATIGGMGLTGVILWARIAMLAVSSSLLSVDTDRVDSLDDALAALSGTGGPYRVAWLDLLGPRAGRGVVTRAAHLPGDAVAKGDERTGSASRGRPGGATVRARARVPERWPAGLLRTSTVLAFNALRFARAPRRERDHPESLGAHMFPLDALRAWPRLYGPRGLLQYQLVVPSGQEQVLHRVVERSRRARVPCFLAVLKDFGAANDAPLSFPIPGWTLALDFPRAAPGLDALLDGFDELVAAAGGRVYLTKDARLAPETVSAMYPRLEQWRAIRDRVDPHRLWRSDLALRTRLISAQDR